MEDELCFVLKCYVEEFGPDLVSVHVPRSWHNVKYSLGDRVKLYFDTESTVDIRVIEFGISKSAEVAQIYG